MKRKQPYPVFYFFILLSLLPVSDTCAQNAPLKECKARVKANRDKLFRYNGYQAIESEFRIGENTVKFVHKDTFDSVYIYKPDQQLIGTLRLHKNGVISSPLSLTYVANGLELTDSIVPDSGKRKLNSYFEGLLSSNSVLWTAEPKVGIKTYYAIGGSRLLAPYPAQRVWP